MRTDREGWRIAVFKTGALNHSATLPTRNFDRLSHTGPEGNAKGDLSRLNPCTRCPRPQWMDAYRLVNIGEDSRGTRKRLGSRGANRPMGKLRSCLEP